MASIFDEAGTPMTTDDIGAAMADRRLSRIRRPPPRRRFGCVDTVNAAAVACDV